MESENLELKEEQRSSLNKVTPLSKYLAMILFIVMPFIGGWIGYMYAPEKVFEKEVIHYIQPKVTEIERQLTLSEIENLYFNEWGAIKLVNIPHPLPLSLSGTIETNIRLDEDGIFLIRLDDESVLRLPEEVVKVVDGQKSVVIGFQYSHPVLENISIHAGDRIRIGITEYYKDTRRIETHDSAALITAEILE